MALKKNLTINVRGVSAVVSNAYIKVAALTGGKTSMNIAVDVFDGDNFVQREGRDFTPSLDAAAPNFIAQAYMHLKTLPEFAGAEDC